MNEKSSEPYHESQLYKIRHSTSHLMAAAVLEMFPEGRVAIGPPIENGFYYDFDLPRALTPEDLEQIEARMRALIAEHHDFVYQEITPEEARRLFADQPYKLELIDGILAGGVDEDGNPVLEAPKLSIYKSGAFIDLCRGPHVRNSREINPQAVKLLNVAGAYWRGDERRPMLQRIYGTAFESPKELKAYLDWLEEVKKRDHRRLIRELDLLSFHEEAGPGLAYWHPRGAIMRKTIEDFWRDQHLEGGYEFVYTPHIGKSWLWETSGHLDFYRESMYSPMDVDGQDYYLKPMNCPFHILIYKTRLRSYRELPLRWAELGTVYRYEKSGVLHGLMRVRGFTQDDAHIICTPEQIEDEVLRVLRFSLALLRAFGFEQIEAYLSTRPEKAVGEPARWEQAQESLLRAINAEGLVYQVDEGGGAFYGPKIDLKIKDALGREWQLTTIQFDFNLPERFDMTYVGEDGNEHRPYMVHRALLGSLERFFGILVEHYAGAFPVWLAPEQARIIPIADRHIEYAKQVEDALRQAHLRVSTDVSASRMNAKIREAQMQKVPYMLVIGDKEVEAGAVAVRLRSGKDLGAMPVTAFIAHAEKAIAERTLE
ncbi:MAG TPA: threonine--tRNA ligase [Anaerolineae bacterium]|nr:threonine--tRNA ligase [Anaerolineae bacterium]HQK15257.1 threonine--tRNA ligase [Anaerolineae bacterium]